MNPAVTAGRQPRIRRGEMVVPLEGPLPRSIAIATPSYDGNVWSSFLLSMMDTERVARRLGIRIDWLTTDTVVDLARAELVADFLKTSADVLLFIDADQAWRPRAVFDVCRLAMRLDLVGAAVPIKSVSWGAVWEASRRLPDRLTAEKVLPAVSAVGRAFLPEGDALPLTEPFEVKFIGAGFLGIHRRVFEQMAEAYPELAYRRVPAGRDSKGEAIPFAFFQPMVHDGYRLGEDYSFVHRWKALGGRCWAINWPLIQHRGPQAFVDCATSRALLGLSMIG